jgi:hypothetical protein
MAKKSSIVDVFEKNQYDLATAAKKSRVWFDKEIVSLMKQRITPKTVMNNDHADLKSRVVPGSLYMYMYDPKYKEELPYYDRFPLVLPYDTFPGGFIGLNLHYVPYQMRVVLLDRLMTFATNQNFTETTRIKYSWDLVRSASRYAAAKPCIKQYLNNHVVSPFRKVHPQDWVTALMLPVEQFVGDNKVSIWKESAKIMRKG